MTNFIKKHYNIMQKRGKWQQIVLKAVEAKKSPSSLPDIKKWVANNYNYNTSNPKNWPKLNKAKRELVEEKILIKVKGKFKISTKPPSPQKKKPKSATKTGGGKKKRKSPKKIHKFQNEIEWWNNPDIILPLSLSLLAGGYAALVWIDNKLAEREGREKKLMKERRKTARKELLKNTNIPQVIIDEITNRYLFSELDKKYSN